MSKTPNLNDLSFDAVIPSALLLNENLEPNAIKLYAFVRGLTKAHGYCYATNEYLSACMKMSISQTRALLTSLEKEKFIRKKFDPETGQRHIYLGGGVPEIQQGGAENPAGGCRKSSTRYKDNIFDKSIDITPPNPQKEEAPDGARVRIAFGKYVQLFQAEYDFFCSTHGKQVIDLLIEEMNDYIASTGKKPYRDFGAALRQWLRRRAQPNTPKTLTNDLELLQKLKAYTESNPRVKMRCGADYVVFPDMRDAREGTYKAGEHGFQEKVLNQMRKMGIPVN